jgi:hypothetical protein
MNGRRSRQRTRPAAEVERRGPVAWIERLLRRSGGALLRRGGLGAAEDHKQTGVVQGQIPNRPAVGADNPIRKRRGSSWSHGTCSLVR